MAYLGTPVVTILDAPYFVTGLRTAININALCARDNWTCGLCGGRISKVVSHGPHRPHSLGKSVDHVIPIRWGGPDTDENLQAAHLGCNQEKGDRLFERDYVVYEMYRAVLDRDGSCCYICERQAFPNAPRDHAWKAVIDQVVPPYLGGGRLDPNNLRVAHFWCNDKKGSAIDCRIRFRYDGLLSWKADIVRRLQR